MNLLVAEWKKVTLNFKVTGFLVWIFPVGLAAFYGMMLVAGLIDRRAAEGMLSTGSGSWTQDAVGIWMMVNAFPVNIIGRMLPLAFVATMFASEYQSGMWKNLLPRARRARLVLSKFAVLVTVIMLSLLATSLVIPVGQGLGHLVMAKPYGPEITSTVIYDFGRDYLQSAGLGLASLLILSAGAALAAILTRSILGGLLIGLGFSIADPLTLVGLNLLGSIFQNPGLINFYRYFPSYNLTNAMAWLQFKIAYIPGSGFIGAPGLGFSLAMLAAWIVALVGLAVVIFEKQDIGA